MCQYLDDLLNIDIEYFKQMIDTIYAKELQLNKTAKCPNAHLSFIV